MTIAGDTQWLRSQLTYESFHDTYSQKWVAVRDEQIVHSSSDLGDMQSWLEQNDKNRQCVLAFGDNRALV